MNLFRASQQWANRPADERFWTLEDMLTEARKVRAGSATKTQAINSLRAVATDDMGLVLEGQNARASMTHFSFGQLIRFATPDGKASPNVEHIRRLPAPLAAQVMNYDLSRCNETSKILLDTRGSDIQARAFTTPKYGRIWNESAIEKLIPLQSAGWRVPPARPSSGNDPRARPATEADVLKSRFNQGGGLAINVGSMIAPAGLYMGEKDMFAFMVNEDRAINGGGKTPLYRGFFLENSEVGSLSYWVTTFLYNTVCGNHIVWGASNVKEIRVVHVGSKAGDRAVAALRVQLTEYADESASDIEAKIKVARTFEFGTTKDEVVETLYAKKIATQTALEAAFDAAIEHPEDGGEASPRSAWGMAQGMTRLSQLSQYMDKRVELDRAAGKILDLATGKGKKTLEVAAV